MQQTRTETDSFGPIEISTEKLWGAQTQRSQEFFQISTEKIPRELILALAAVKQACASVNCDLGKISSSKADAIIKAAGEVMAGLHDDEFPLSVWQTGSGTQTNMNMNEVLANRASQLLGGGCGEDRLLHPNDDVNASQSSNDIFPTAMHVVAVEQITGFLQFSLQSLRQTLQQKSNEFESIVKIGRTHLQDATPLTLAQEFSGYVAQLDIANNAIASSLPALYALAAGGTAVGTGLNAHPQFGERVAAKLASMYRLPFYSATNKFAALAGHEPLVAAHGALKTLATALMKIANDIRWLASGPRAGLGEINLPENEPGSSIMPGKVNPTQCEAMTMLCCQIIGNDVALSIGAASGNFELNVFKPLIIHNFLQSVRLLNDGMASFDMHCARGITPNRTRIKALVSSSLMLVTGLAPHIGYDQSAQIAKKASVEATSLKEAAMSLGYVSEEDFDRWTQPLSMTASTE
jgi:fumarate hydratase class II